LLGGAPAQSTRDWHFARSLVDTFSHTALRAGGAGTPAMMSPPQEDLPMSPNWKVRRIRAGEGPRLRALRLRALAEAPSAFGSTLAREEAYAEEVWQQRAVTAAAGATSVTVVAELADRWVGMATGLAPEADASAPMGPILVGMFVDSDLRRLGIGEALVESIKNWARSHGHQRIHLWVVCSNAPALALYRRCGFQASGVRRPLAHTPGLTELQMLAFLRPG
jgi:GNAT superfamily N-acetyltransferase